MAVFPTALVTTADIPNAGANLSTNPHSSLHDETRDEVVAIEAELGIAPSGSYSTVAARLAAGWQPIAAATFSAAATVDISISASTYRLVRIVVTANTASGESVVFNGRVNNDVTASLHRTVEASSFSDATSTAAVLSTAWQIGRVGTVAGQLTELLINNADTSSNLPWKSSSISVGSFTEADMRVVTAGGSLSAARTISSLRIFPSTSTISGSYVAEGYVTP